MTLQSQPFGTDFWSRFDDEEEVEEGSEGHNGGASEVDWRSQRSGSASGVSSSLSSYS